ncbi:MAG: fatty acid desaturase [Armatimonadetes bacterium]|nr:fatty acid desaturase [Armatimonadota bacterium]
MKHQRTLPRLSDLGDDLLESTPWQRWQPMFMPPLYAFLFMAAWHFHLWPVSLAMLVMVFSASSTSTHDVLHGCLGLRKRASEWLIFFLGACILESGHAYRATHLRHHATFPDHEDVEGEAAHWPLWRVLLFGPAFLPRLWLTAWGQRPADRLWLLVEAMVFPTVLALSLLVCPLCNSPLVYTVAVWVSSWFYPVFAVWLPHQNMLERPVRISRTFRGRFLPKLFLPLAYHLEHHLYPKVPSHNLPELARRLEPFLVQAGVEPVLVP